MAAAQSAVGDWIVYREPQRNGGRRAYIAVARVVAIEADRLRRDHAYAIMGDYLPFDRPVPFAGQGAGYWEAPLRAIESASRVGASLQGKAMRPLSDTDFSAIVAAGLAETLSPQNAIRLGLADVAPNGVAEIGTPFDHGLDPIRRVEQMLVNRKIRDANFRRHVCEAYDDRCAVTGLRIINGGGRSEVQAAHIWSVGDGGPESYPEAERLASELRSFIYPGEVDGPAIDLPQRLRSLDGLIVSQLKNSKYEGASVAAGGYLFVFVSPRFPARTLFTLGHELGHVVAHHSLQAAHLDLATNIGSFRNRSEGFADAFSSAFLLPSRAVGGTLQAVRQLIGATSDEIGDIEILILARMHGVSFDVAARRCEALDLLPVGGAASLADYLRQHHKNPEKRAEALNLPPRETMHFDAVSPVLMKFVHASVERGLTSPSWIADRLGTSIESIYKTHASTGERRASTHWV